MSIPQRIRASLAVAHGERHSGTLPLAGFSRLREALADAAGDLRVELAGAHDSLGHPVLDLHAAAELRLLCQRCMTPFGWTLDRRAALRLVATDEEEARLMNECEPYRVQDDWLPLHEIVEDEVLLALPMLPRCPSCENAVRSAPEPERADPRPNPFAALKDLKLGKKT
ncbi:MAG: DUF177 domain-containing protein [Gammaproteobacteria bacterium]|nr:DUF177 domain-containing protein [Gammaproteobacteria bacterium]